jgi:hypothetical protein
MFQDIITEKLDMANLSISFIAAAVLSYFLDKVAFQVAWDASPGGSFGSIIHYSVRIVVFALLWIMAYFLLWFNEWIKTNYMVFIMYIVTFAFAVASLFFFKRICSNTDKL